MSKILSNDAAYNMSIMCERSPRTWNLEILGKSCNFNRFNHSEKVTKIVSCIQGTISL